MSLILNESFYDILFKHFVTLSEILNIFKFIVVIGFIIIISYMLYYIHGYYIIF